MAAARTANLPPLQSVAELTSAYIPPQRGGMLEEAVPSSAGCPVFYLPLALTVTSCARSGESGLDYLWVYHSCGLDTVSNSTSWYSEGCNRVTTLNLVL